MSEVSNIFAKKLSKDNTLNLRNRTSQKDRHMIPR